MTAQTRWGLRAALALAVTLMTASVLFREFNGGLLSGLLPWDDCAIFDQATQRILLITRADSLAHMVMQARSLAPHGPVADIQTMLGLLLSGGETWGPYALSGVLVLSCILPVVEVAWRRRGMGVAIAIAIMMLFQPLTIYALMSLKADWKSGLFMASALYLYAEAIAANERRLWTLGSVFLALSILCKLTAFYLPVCAVIIIGLFEIAGLEAWSRRPSRIVSWIADAFSDLWRARGRWGQSVAIACTPFVLFFAWGSVSNYNLINYIRGALSPVWRDGLTYGERALFYAPGSNETWGLLPFEAALFAGLALVFAIRRRDGLALRVLAAIVLAAIMLYLPLVASGGGDIEFSGTFLGVVLASVLIGISQLPRNWSWAAAAICGLFAVFTPLTGFDVVLVQREPAVTTQERQDAARSFDRVATDIAALRGGRTPRVVLLFEDMVAGFPNLSIAYFRKTSEILPATRDDQAPLDPPAAAGEMEFFLLLVPSQAGTPAGYRPQRRFPTTRDLEGTRRLVESDPQLAFVRAYPWKNGELRLYLRRPGTAPPDAAR